MLFQGLRDVFGFVGSFSVEIDVGKCAFSLREGLLGRAAKVWFLDGAWVDEWLCGEAGANMLLGLFIGLVSSVVTCFVKCLLQIWVAIST